MDMNPEERVLAQRLGTTVHVSPLRMKLARLREAYPSPSTECLEDWLVDVANHPVAVPDAQPTG